MSTLIKLIFHPFYTFALDDGDEDGSNVELFYFMTGFFAVGIWLVVQRYQWIHNRAIDFKINYPIVRVLLSRPWYSWLTRTALRLPTRNGRA